MPIQRPDRSPSARRGVEASTSPDSSDTVTRRMARSPSGAKSVSLARRACPRLGSGRGRPASTCCLQTHPHHVTLRCAGPRNIRHAGCRFDEQTVHRRRQHFPETPAGRLKAPFLDDRPEIQAIARARQCDVEQALGLLAIALRLIFIGSRLEVADGHRHIVGSLAARFESNRASSPCRETR